MYKYHQSLHSSTLRVALRPTKSPAQALRSILNNDNTNATKRSVSTSLHVKGLPTILPKEEIYNFFKNYGKIDEVAIYNEAPNLKHMKNESKNKYDNRIKRKQHFIPHDRPPGQTAVITFQSSHSAIMCKEELHWRPFPIVDVDVDANVNANADINNKINEGVIDNNANNANNNGDNYVYRPFLDEDIISRNARDRPLVNILFETTHMREKLRPWVKRDLQQSKRLIKAWDKEKKTKQNRMDQGVNSSFVHDDKLDFNTITSTAYTDADVSTSTSTNTEQLDIPDLKPSISLDGNLEKDTVHTNKNINSHDVKVDDISDQETNEETKGEIEEIITNFDFDSMKLVELQNECKTRNLPKYGRKVEIQHRLKEFERNKIINALQVK